MSLSVQTEVISEQHAPELAYLQLRAALHLFSKPMADLDVAQRARVERQARREHALGARVLATPEAHGIVVPDSSVDVVYAEIAGRYPDTDAFHADLARHGMTPPALRTALHRELRVEAVLERVGAGTEVGEADITIYYHSHPERFRYPETRTARHILVTVNPEFADNTPAAARARIEAIARRLGHDPLRFAEEAQRHSECPSALQGGLLGRVPRGKLFAELDAVLFELRAGEVSGVVESPLGLHLLLCERIHDAGSLTLDEARPRIREILEQRYRGVRQRQWLEGLTGRSEG